MAPMETRGTVSCYCGLNTYSLNLFTSSNPYPVPLCHCSTCRHWSGALFTATIPCSPPPESVLANLTEYKTSENVTRLFCTNCGSPMHQKRSPTNEWEVSVGVLEDKGQLKLVMGAHQHVGDTGDGGMSGLLPKSDGKILDRWAGVLEKSERLPLAWTNETTIPRAEEERVLARCHCGGVKFYITRPNEASKTAIPPGWSENVLGPYPNADKSDSMKETWWLRPLGQDVRRRYLAGICVCDTCTRGLGFWFPAWSYIPLCNLVHADGTQVDLANLGTLKSARRSDSRPGVHRDFCGRCGATVFWWREARGPMLDVALGLLQAEDARAEAWFEWQTWRIIRKDDGKEKKLIEELEEGMKTYKPRSED